MEDSIRVSTVRRAGKVTLPDRIFHDECRGGSQSHSDQMKRYTGMAADVLQQHNIYAESMVPANDLETWHWHIIVYESRTQLYFLEYLQLTLRTDSQNVSIYLQLERGIVASHFTRPLLSVTFEVGEIASPTTVELHNTTDSITVRRECIRGHPHI